MDRDQTEYIAESIMQHKDIAEKKTNKKAQKKITTDQSLT